MCNELETGHTVASSERRLYSEPTSAEKSWGSEDASVTAGRKNTSIYKDGI